MTILNPKQAQEQEMVQLTIEMFSDDKHLKQIYEDMCSTKGKWALVHHGKRKFSIWRVPVKPPNPYKYADAPTSRLKKGVRRKAFLTLASK